MKKLRWIYLSGIIGFIFLMGACGGDSGVVTEGPDNGAVIAPEEPAATPEEPVAQEEPAPEPAPQLPSIGDISENIHNVVVGIGMTLPDFDNYQSCTDLFENNVSGFKETVQCSESGSAAREIVSLSCVGAPLQMTGEFRVTSDECVDSEIPAFNGSMNYKVVKDSAMVKITITSENLTIDGVPYELHLAVIAGDPYICSGSIKVQDMIFTIDGQNSCSVNP